MEKFNKTIRLAANQEISDLHFMPEQPLVFRKNGIIYFDPKNKWPQDQIMELCGELMSQIQKEALSERKSVDFAVTLMGIRIRVNIFYTTTGISLAIRLLPGKIPSINDLNLHPSLQEMCKTSSGLFLICGATGSGKSTTIAAMVEEINRTRPAHIITIEDPVEYRYSAKKALIAQRELGTHVPSYERGLLDVLREDPDVIVIGELREMETIRLTLHAAESGHLVIASLHASTFEDAIHRICNSFPADGQDSVRGQLSSTLELAVIQQLVYYKRTGFRIPILSILRSSQSIKGLIRENKLAQLESAVQTSKGKGMFTAEAYEKEFIETRASFVPPSKSFRPSKMGQPEAASPVEKQSQEGIKIAVEEPVSVYGEAAQPPEVQPVESSKPAQPGISYIIDEQSSMDQLIKEIKQSGMY